MTTDLISKEEEALFLEDFNNKYKIKVKESAEKLAESKDQAKASKAIHAFIKDCDDLDTLTFLHQELLSPKYNFLRTTSVSDQKGISPHYFFKAIVSEGGEKGKSSKAWADIEESFELQMVHILDTSCRLDPALGKERAEELRKDNPFFGMQHLCSALTPDSAEDEIIKRLRVGDVQGLEKAYEKHFKMCM